eukprot:COSAG04_NODE_1112_length_8221_cov_6.736764_5_plen_263_part_00
MMKLPPAESSKGTEKEPAQTTEEAKVKEDAVPQKTEEEKVTEGKVPQAKPDMAAADAKPPKDESNDSEAEGFDPFEVAEKHEAEQQQQRKQQPEMPAKVSDTAEASKPAETIEERRPAALPQVQKADAVTDASNARPQPVRKLALRNHRAADACLIQVQQRSGLFGMTAAAGPSATTTAVAATPSLFSLSQQAPKQQAPKPQVQPQQPQSQQQQQPQQAQAPPLQPVAHEPKQATSPEDYANRRRVRRGLSARVDTPTTAVC